MKKVTLTDAQLTTFQNRLTSVWGIYDSMNLKLNAILEEYSIVEYKLSREQLHPTQAQKDKEAIKEKAKQRYKDSTIDALEDLFIIKREYLEAVMPSESIKYDLVELTLLEKEMSVMTDDELDQYYRDHWLDNTLSRLLVVEFKKRSAAKGYTTTYLDLITRDNHSDEFIKQVDDFIKFATAMARSADSILIYIADPINRKTYTMAWDVLFREIHIRNLHGNHISVKLSDLKDPAFGTRTSQELSIIGKMNGSLQVTNVLK